MSALDDLITELRCGAWDEQTAAPNTPRAGHGKPHGQCAVTALLVHDELGGAILRCEMPDGSSHYWNRIIAVGEVDLTREQYDHDAPIPRGVEVPRERLTQGERAAAARTVERYELLKKRVREGIRSNHDPRWD